MLGLWVGFGMTTSILRTCNGEFLPTQKETQAHVFESSYTDSFHSALHLCSDLWYLPSASPAVSIDLGLVQGGSVSSPLAALARLGTNNVTLSFMAGFTQDLNFTIV